MQHDGDRFLPEVHLSWTDVFYGRKLLKDEDELSEWEKKDLEKRGFVLYYCVGCTLCS